jgi:hypothetical protein
MRRPCADREEKRVLHGRDIKQEEEEQLDSRNPNQRRLSIYTELAMSSLSPLTAVKTRGCQGSAFVAVWRDESTGSAAVRVFPQLPTL